MAEVLEHPQRPGRRGVLVIVVLGAIFFTLLVLLLRAGTEARPNLTRSREELYVLPTRLRIRTLPDAKAPVVATAVRGEKLRLLEDRGAWVRVQNREGISGWADRGGLEAANEYDRRLARYAAMRKLPTLEGQVEERVPLYAGPGIFYSIVGELTPASRIRIYTRDHDFYAVDVGGDIAYAEVDAISLSTAGAAEFEVAASTREREVPGEERGEFPIPERSFPQIPIPQMPPPLPELPPQPAPVESRVYPAVPVGGTQPEVVHRVMPRYPAEARRAGTQGRVLIRAIIRRDGSVDNVHVLTDLPDGLGNAAAKAVSQWRFRPATYQGEPIDVYYTVTVNFRLD
jgi:TonB family protein